jgi:hypothetical protein
MPRNDLNCENVSGGVILTTGSTLDGIGLVPSTDTKKPRNSISVRNREHLLPFTKRSCCLKESKTFSNFSRCSWGSSVLVKMQMSSTYQHSPHGCVPPTPLTLVVENNSVSKRAQTGTPPIHNAHPQSRTLFCGHVHLECATDESPT